MFKKKELIKNDNSLKNLQSDNLEKDKKKLEGIKYYNINEKENIKLRKNSDCSDSSISHGIVVNNIYTNNLYFNNYLRSESNSNYFKNRNYSHSGIRNINLKDNNSKNFINGIPRRNKKIVIVRKSNPLIDCQIISTGSRNYIHHSPNCFKLDQTYGYNQSCRPNNINYGFSQPNIADKYNNYLGRVRGSYNINMPNKYCFGYRLYSTQNK